jgi:hypothetical protein
VIGLIILAVALWADNTAYQASKEMATRVATKILSQNSRLNPSVIALKSYSRLACILAQENVSLVCHPLWLESVLLNKIDGLVAATINDICSNRVYCGQYVYNAYWCCGDWRTSDFCCCSQTAQFIAND